MIYRFGKSYSSNSLTFFSLFIYLCYMPMFFDKGLFDNMSKLFSYLIRFPFIKN